MTTQKKKKKKQTKSPKVVRKKAVPRKKAAPKKVAAKKKKPLRKNRVQGKSERATTVAFEPKGVGVRRSGQSGDLQGLSNSASADSESVDELLEEGNAFEAEVVEGVQDAPDADRGGIKTHEVPEDDVPEEYLDEDR